ncbi:restriction endonuclease subunit S [Achromobacter sp. NPDC008082]|uniref:restriction endonuclease subunit S n=1 Tax=Achromobacter sp. NPDC008082 TaxID=3363888 RepID=UPI0036E9B816
MKSPPTQLGTLVNEVSTWNPSRDHQDKEFTYIDLGSIDQMTKAITGARKISCGDAPSRARQLVKPGDILVSTVRPNLNGVAKISDALGDATASTGFCVLRPQKDRLDSSYLFHWVKTRSFVGAMVKQATGASYPAVSDKIIFASKLPLPPLLEQRRIAAILDKADVLRAQRRAAIAKLDELQQSVFIEMFGDPVTNPRGWPETTSLGEVAEIISGITKGRKTAATTRDVAYMAVSNVQDRFLKLDVVKRIEATDDEIEKYRLQRGDLLLTEGGDPDKLGRGVLWRNEIAECIHQNHVFRVRLTSDQLHPLYLNWYVGSERGKRYFLRQAKQTTGIASINMRQLRDLPLLIPPLELQQHFARIAEKIEFQKQIMQRAAEKAETLFASLQQCAFSGKL